MPRSGYGEGGEAAGLNIIEGHVSKAESHFGVHVVGDDVHEGD